jgi:hypothetical protein
VTPTYQPRRLGADEDHRWRAPISPPNCRRAAPLAFSLNRDSDELTLHAACCPQEGCPTTPGRTSYLLTTAYGGASLRGLAAVLSPLLDLCPRCRSATGLWLAGPRYSAPGTAPTSVPVPARRWPRLSPTRCPGRPSRLAAGRRRQSPYTPPPHRHLPPRVDVLGRRLAIRGVAAGLYQTILDGSPRAGHQLCPAASPMTTVQGRMVHEVTKPWRT